MTPDPRKLADAIDPRKAVSDPAMIRPDSSHRWCIPASDLIAASDFLRTLPNPTPDVADLVKRLRDEATEQIRVANHIDDDEMADSYFLGLRASHPSWQAADMLTLLQAQVAVARKMAVEECAGVCDAENTRLLSEARQTFGEEKYKKNYAAEWCAWLATTIRALTPPDPAGGMLEKVKEEGR
jgi:hypothetical protein